MAQRIALHHRGASNEQWTGLNAESLNITGDVKAKLREKDLDQFIKHGPSCWEMVKMKLKNIEQVEKALLEDPSVDDCVVLVRTTENSGKELVSYVVPSGPFSAERLEANLQAVLPENEVPKAYVPVSSLPLTPTGQVDKQALARLEVIDNNLVKLWEERLRSLPEIEQAAVVIQERVERSLPLHLSDLLPGWKTASSRDIDKPIEVTTCQASVPEKLGPKALAISHGGPLQKEAGAPTTLSASLTRAAKRGHEKGVIYIQPDDSKTFQSYPALLEMAQRILTGLRKRGLKPQDKVIFQFARNQDFIPAFWGCVLGGFVPVPMAIAPSYKESNSTVNKLHNAWRMLEQPHILTSEHLVPAVCSLSDLLNLKDFHVESIDKMSVCEPDRNWHDSQPDDLALLMLTSGSTGMPKGVKLSHDNLLSRSAGSAQMNGFSSQDVTLNWMPLDHVAGIIYFHLRDVFLGCMQIHAPTDLVLQGPLKWLDWIDRFRATITFAPNFAYGLVNDHAKEIGRRRWDLSSMQFILNGAEAIVAKTARRFLELLAPHGLSSTAMHPAWGMSETSSGVTYSDSFSLGSTKDDDPFVEVGTPIPGFSMRIVDAQNQVEKEGTIGRLQVKGSTVTSGYYKNPELNREVFTDDGWFKTGDLGFLRKGNLTITGREKDVVIINSVNYYCHEIESKVEEIEGVETSYTAACAVRDPSIDTDKLAIFFHPSSRSDVHLIELLKDIRRRVVKTVGVNPDYLIPVQKQDIPKTSIGKIQRSQLSQRFEAGEFDEILKQIDILSGNVNTLPDWFYRKIWHRKEEVTLAPQHKTCQSLIFLDQLGLGTRLCVELSKHNRPCVGVKGGYEFAELGSYRYRIDPKNPDHYRRLLMSLTEGGIQIDQVLHLWTYDEDTREVSSPEELEQAQVQGVYSLLFLIQALNQVQVSQRPLSLYVISSYIQPISSAEEIAYKKAPILGLVKTIPQEMPWVNCRHVDLPIDRVEMNVDFILREIRVVQRDREVAYRDGQRFVPRLKKVDLQQEKMQGLPFKPEGMYLISGGLGGLGLEISRYLLKNFRARLLLVGRTPLPERSEWETCLKQVDAVSQRVEAYRALEQLEGEVIYEAVDVCDLNSLQKVVERAKSLWQCELNGIVHLAGIYRENTVVEETRESLAAMFRSKMLGTWVLHQLIKNQKHGVFICFSSVAGFFGGAIVSAYSAANNFLDYFSHYQRYRSTLHHYSFAWSNWDGVGLSRHYRIKELPRARGYQPMTPEQALNSFLIGLHHDQGQLLVGLIGSNRHVRRYVESESYQLQKLTAYLTTQNDSLSFDELQALVIQDRFQTPSICEFLKLRKMPMTEAGEIDRDKLLVISEHTFQVIDDRISPRTELERQIASLWQEVLAVPQICVHDNFFELGGDSLMAVRLLSRIYGTFQVEMSLESLFEAPTVAGLATAVTQCCDKHKDSPVKVTDKIKGEKAEELLAKVNQLSDEEVDSLLIDMLGEEGDGK